MAPNLTIDDYKKFALSQAALQPPQNPSQIPANIAAPPPDFQPPAQAQMPNPMPNIQAPAAPQVQQQPQQQQPAPSVTNVQQNQGPIKTFLSQFLYGAGQGLVAHAGLETDPQKQQRLFTQNLQTQSAAGQSSLRQAQADYYSGKTDATQAQNQPVDTATLGIPGLTGVVLQKDLPRIIVQHVQNQGREKVGEDRNQTNRDIAALKYGDGSKPGPLNTVIKDIGGHTYLLRKGTGEKLSDLGTSNTIATAEARARYAAQYGLVNTLDEDSNPISTSRLTALRTGAPTASFDALKAIASDRVGINQYAEILDKKIGPNLTVLNDPKQRAIIAHTLSEAEKNPGAIQSLLTSGAQSGLSAQGAALAAGILQGREFGGVARKYGGNMNGTEGLMNRIMSNQASPLNTEQLNRELIQNDRDFTKKAMGALGGLTSHRLPSGKGPGDAPIAPAATAPASAHSFFGQFGGSAKQP